jgi:hypothetical protein
VQEVGQTQARLKLNAEPPRESRRLGSWASAWPWFGTEPVPYASTVPDPETVLKIGANQVRI